MNFLSVPDNVVKKGLLPLLGWNDLLRLRRTCKTLKDVVTGYMKEHPERAPELEINENDKKFGDFLRMGIPTTKLYLNNFSGHKFYEMEVDNMTKFLGQFGSFVKQLRVYELAFHVCGMEWDFLEGLTGMESFEAYRFGLGTKGRKVNHLEVILLSNGRLHKAQQDNRYVAANPPIPQIFKQLKYLKIGQDENLPFSSFTDRHDGMVGIAPNLEYVGLPLSLYWDDLAARANDYRETMKMAFLCLSDYISQLGASCLKTVDFFSYYNFMPEYFQEMELCAGDAFGELLQVAFKHNVKLLNVRAPWFWRCGGLPAKLGKTVGSLINIHLWIFPVDLSRLTRIEIKATSQCYLGPGWIRDRPHWPALKQIDITVDSGDEETKAVFELLFGNVRRLQVTELRINFVGEKKNVAVMKMENVVESCPNLKRFELINWPGTNKALIGLWEGLQGLEEITLEKCKNVGNVTFVGLDTKNPVFFKLKNLRKLTLKGVDKMPKITDLLFSLVIRHLNLTHFGITSEQPIEHVTVASISRLLEGKFAETIEKFPFQGWSMKNVTSEEFQSLEKKFRSFDMI